MTGIRIGIVFQSIGAAVTGLSIGFSVSWKLSLVALCFAPVVFISTKLRAQKSGQTGQKTEKPLFAEEGGQVMNKTVLFNVSMSTYCFSMQHKRLNIFVL